MHKTKQSHRDESYKSGCTVMEKKTKKKEQKEEQKEEDEEEEKKAKDKIFC